MCKTNFFKILFLSFIFVFGTHHCWASEVILPKVELNDANLPGVGRDNPFGEITEEPKVVSPETANALPKSTGATPLFLESVTLKFLNAKDLKQAMTNMSSGLGSISANEKTNTLIICDTKDNVARILAEIRKADRIPQQLMVEVVVVDVKLDNQTEIGVNWDVLTPKVHDVSLRQSLTERVNSTVSSPATIGDATAFNSTPPGRGTDLAIVTGNVRNVIHLLQTKKDVEILASPRVMVVSGQTASIDAVEEIPYTERSTASGGGELTSTQFKDVGVKLEVTATLADANLILLNVRAEQKVSTGQSVISGVPTVDARIAHSSLVLEDGQVVIMGGLRRKEITKQKLQVPFFGDIPVIGFLFRSTDDVVNNSELIVFLSPHVYKGEPIPQEAMAKFTEIKDRPMLSLPNKDDKNEKP